MKKLLLLVSCVLALLGSCKTDFDVNAPYKETMVIYGFLNTLDSVQYIRISKAYLGEGNAYLMAQQSDSINYPDILDVKLEKISSGGVVQTFSLIRVESIPKNPGIFASPFQVYYTTNHRIDDDGSTYKLTVTNRQTGRTATSFTQIVSDISVQHPSIADADFATAYPSTADFYPGSNARVFDFVICFHYSEIDSAGNVTQDSVDWNFSQQVSSEDTTALVQFGFYRPDFFTVLGQKIPVKPGVTRRVDNLPPGIKPVEFRFLAGTEDLLTYQQLIEPSTGIVQDKPLFTTVQNGIGLFTSRLVHKEFRNLSANTKAAFDTSSYTRNLNFHF